jgi:hypothetical protein
MNTKNSTIVLERVAGCKDIGTEILDRIGLGSKFEPGDCWLKLTRDRKLILSFEQTKF